MESCCVMNVCQKIIDGPFNIGGTLRPNHALWESFSPTPHTLKPLRFSCGKVDSTGICEALREKWSCVSAIIKMHKVPRRGDGVTPDSLHIWGIL